MDVGLGKFSRTLPEHPSGLAVELLRPSSTVRERIGGALPALGFWRLPDPSAEIQPTHSSADIVTVPAESAACVVAFRFQVAISEALPNNGVKGREEPPSVYEMAIGARNFASTLMTTDPCCKRTTVPTAEPDAFLESCPSPRAWVHTQ